MGIRYETRYGLAGYDIRTRGPDGKPIRERKAFPPALRTTLARKQWAESRDRHLTLHGLERRDASRTLAQWADEWIEACQANKLRPATLDAYRTRLRLHVLPVLGTLPLTEIDNAAATRLKLSMASKEAKTVNDSLGVLSALLRLAYERKLIAAIPPMPRLKVETGDTLRFYDFAEWERLVAGAAAAGPMVLATVLLAGEAGLRRGELVALEQVDIGPTEIAVRWSEWQKSAKERHTGGTKSRRVRRVPMTSRLRAAVQAVRHLRGKRLLWKPEGERVSLTTLQSWLETACRRAGLAPSRDIHKLRHTFCSHLAMRGATAVAIKDLAGHADLATTMRYMHLSPSHKESAIRLLEAGDSAGTVPVATQR